MAAAGSPTAAAAAAAAPPYVFPCDKLRRRPGSAPDATPVVLLACGSFNPPTVLHLRMFELAADRLRELGYELLGGYISPVNDGYGKAGLLPAGHRLALCAASAASSDLVMVDPWEAVQGGYQRTLQVLAHLRDEVTAWAAEKKDETGAPQKARV